MNAVGNIVGRLTKFFAERFPDTQNILGVYSVIVFLIYSWTLIISFYKVPSWLFYLTIGQILSIYAYSFLANLVESLLILAGVLLLEVTIFFPLKNKDEFQSRSILMAFSILVSSMTRLLLYKSFEASEVFVSGELTWWILTVLLGLFFAITVSKRKKIRGIVEGIAKRVTVFLYVYIPISLLSIIVVIVRNLN
jgi:hypothetical protein